MSWSAGDAAMNNLFSYALHAGGPELEDLPPFARRVFEAFDEGEYEHPGESAEFHGEARTSLWLKALMNGSTEAPALLGKEASTRRVRATAAAIARRALIHSETTALPLGPVRQYWAAGALTEKDKEIARAETWAMEIGATAFRNIARRFGGAA
jgi:hypothetical protein